MAQRKALGRGLGALLGTSELDVEQLERSISTEFFRTPSSRVKTLMRKPWKSWPIRSGSTASYNPLSFARLKMGFSS